MEHSQKIRLEVTNIIEPVLLTKLHIQRVGKSGINAMSDLLKLVCLDYKLKPNNGSDFRVALKIIEQSVYQN